MIIFILHAIFPIGFDPRLSLVLYFTEFDGEPVPVCIVSQQEGMDAVLPVVLVPVLQSDLTDLHQAFGYWIPDKK